MNRSTFTTPLRANTQSSYNSSVNGYFGNNTFNAYGSTIGHSTTTISGGDVINIDKPLTQVAIKLYKNQVNGALDADIILSNFVKPKN